MHALLKNATFKRSNKFCLNEPLITIKNILSIYIEYTVELLLKELVL